MGGKRLLVVVLSIQFILAGGLPAYAGDADRTTGPGAETGSLSPLQSEARNAALPEQSEMEKVIGELQDASENTLPPLNKNPLRLQQELTVRKKDQSRRTYDFDDFNVPPVTVTSFQKVRVQAGEKPGTMSFIYEDGASTYTLNVEGIDPVAVARNKEMLVVLDRSGELRAFDMQYTRHQLFKSKIPSFTVGHLNPELVSPHTQISFFNRGLIPYDNVASPKNALIPLDLSEDTLMRGENLIIYQDTPDQGRVLVGILPFDVMRRFLSVGEKAFKKLASMLNPALEDSDSSVYDPEETEVNAKALEVTDSMNNDVRNALIGLSKEEAKFLDRRSRANGIAANTLRDTVSVREWRRASAEILDEGRAQLQNPRAEKLRLDNAALTPLDRAKLADAIANGDLGPYWKTLTEIKRRQIRNSTWFQHVRKTWTTSKSVKLIAALTSLSTMAVAVNDLHRGVGPAWAVHIFNEFYEHFFPNVLKDTAYRVTLAKSVISLTSIVPAMFGIAGLAGYIRKGTWEPAKNLCIAGLRAFAYVSLPFYHYIAAVAQQRNFIRSLQKGISPFRRIKAGTSLGQRLGLEKNVFPAFTNLFQSPDKIKQENDRKGDILAAVTKQETQKRAMAWTLGLIVASHEEDLDPVTVDMMMSHNGVSSDLLKRLQSDPQLEKSWTELSKEILLEIRALGLGEENFDFSTMSMEEIAFYYTLARKTAQRLKSSAYNRPLLDKLKWRWEQIKSVTYQSFGGWGVAQHEYLSKVEPAPFTYKTGARLLIYDYLLEVFQIALWGPRADLSTPKTRRLLTAREGEFLWTSPQHRAETLAKILAYWNLMDSHLALVYQKDRVDRETLYDPIEEVQTDGIATTEHFWTGMRNWWANTLNLPKSRLGAVQLRGLLMKAYSAYGIFMFFAASRLLSGAQSLHDLVPAFIYLMLVGAPRGGGLWDVTARGNQLSDEEYENRAERLGTIRVGLDQGLRINDIQQIQKYFDALVGLYKKKDSAQFPEEIRAIVDRPEAMTESLTRMSPEEVDAYNQYHEATTKLGEALESGDAAGETKAADELRNQYAGGDQASREALLKFNSRRLLNYSLLHPPFATKANPWVIPLHVITSAIIVTELNLFTSIKSFGHEAWSIKIAHGIVLAALFYGGAYALDHLAIYVTQHKQEWKDWISRKLSPHPSAPDTTHCPDLLNKI